MRTIKIEFSGFLKKAIKGYPFEICGMLYAKNLYSDDEEWKIFNCENISENQTEEWIPDTKELVKIKKIADQEGFIKIGNIHTHPYEGNFTIEEMNECVKPSEKDLYYARKFRDLVRIIILVSKNSGIMGQFIHDKFGNEIKVYLDSK